MLLAVIGLAALTSTRGEPSQAEAPRTPQLKTVSVNGTTLSYVDEGRGDAVVLIHGFLHDYRVWSEQWPALSKDHRAVAYSRRHHHPNPWPEGTPETSVGTDVEDLVALIRSLGLAPAHLIGHSAGASIALLVARDHPELVRSLVLGEPVVEAVLARYPEAASVFPPAFFAEAGQAFAQGDDQGGLRILTAGIVGSADAYDRMPPEKRRIAEDNLRLGKAQLLDRRPAPPFSCEDAQGIQAPVLLLEGERTTRMFRIAAASLRACMPRAEHAVLPNASHALELENPAGFNELVLWFLARGRTPPSPPD